VLQRRSVFALVAVFALGAFAYGQDKATLQWKFEKGKPFYQEMTTETTQAMKVMGMDVNQKQKQTFYFSWTPVEQKDKDWIVKQKIEGVKMDIEIGGNKISYDSTNPGTSNNPLSDFFKALVGSEFTLTITPDLKVTKIEGREEFLKKLVSANQQMEPLLKQILSEDALKQMADPSFAAIPNKEVKKGETWKRESKLNLGPIGSYENLYEYTYEGKDEKNKDLDKISVKTTLKYVPPGEGAGAGLPFRIKSADLKSKDATGTILFNSKLGRVESSEMSLTLEGKLSIEIGGQTTEVELNQKQKTTVKTSAENPIAPKKTS
jgi:hypothetical protein